MHRVQQTKEGTRVVVMMASAEKDTQNAIATRQDISMVSLYILLYFNLDMFLFLIGGVIFI